jgi:hypothetical protein
LQPGFPLDHHLVVIGRGKDRLHILNPVARMIHEACSIGTRPEDIAHSISKQFGIPHGTALRDVTAVLDQLHDLEIGPAEIPSRYPEESQAAAEAPATPEPARRADYRIADQPFTIRYGSVELYRAIHGLLAHLGINSSKTKSAVIDVWDEGGFFHVFGRGILRVHSRQRDHAVVGVVREVAELAYRGRDWLAVCHACAVRDGDSCIVMPASGGSGKSTLAAALSCSGWEVFADDVVPVDRYTHEAVTVPIPFNLKSASLPVLSGFEPGFEHTPGFDRGDHTVHYRVPRAFNATPPTVCYPVRLLVYPRFLPGAHTVLRPLDHVTSLQKLIESDCMFPLPLENDLVEELVAWIGGLSAYELIYSDLAEARTELAGLMES